MEPPSMGGPPQSDGGPAAEPSAGPSAEPAVLDYLQTLNEAQRTAVTFPREVPLQILAGPGSGKTRVLTARVAYLVQHWGIAPWDITAVTFTNKAAQEMRKRLNKLLGEQVAGKLVLGTFHATCAGYLRRHGRVIGLPNNFSITDSDDSKKIMKDLIKPVAASLKERHIVIKDAQVLSEISKAKAREETPEAMLAKGEALGPKGEVSVVMAHLYKSYEDTLRAADSLDFDDLLVFGLKLFRASPEILKNCKHILVDEFQDTNTTQYELMKLFAKEHGGVTVVGDPDQSIYGWRAAEIENLKYMKRDFPDTEAIYLEQNYRSTGAILAASLAVVSQDKERIAKGLHTAHPQGTQVTLKPCQSAFSEASFIAAEIKRLVAYHGGLLNYGDFAVLLRYNALSRPIEVALQKESIPNKVVGGHKFFERLEVKDLLAYLQLVDNPNFSPAFARVVNVPKRAVGEKSVQDILQQARAMKISPMRLAEMIAAGETIPNIKSGLRKNLTGFVAIVQDMRRRAIEGLDVAELIKLCIGSIGYEEHLRRTQSDFDSRWENVQELINYAVIVANESQDITAGANDDAVPAIISASDLRVAEVLHNGSADADVIDVDQLPSRADVHPFFRKSSDSSELTDVDEPAKGRKKAKTKTAKAKAKTETDASAGNPPVPTRSEEAELLALEHTPLRAFLQASMLSTDTEAKDGDESKTPKVVLTTVHGAKGLEWPVVFIPCVENGVYPFYRSVEETEIREERRLLYVAMTRAQAVLYLSYANQRMLGGDEMEREMSSFVASAQASSKATPIFALDSPLFTASHRAAAASLLERAPIPEDAALEVVRAYTSTTDELAHWQSAVDRNTRLKTGFGGLIPLFFLSGKKEARASEYWASESDDYALPDIETGQYKRGRAANGQDRPDLQQPAFTSARAAVLHSPKYKKGKTSRQYEEKTAEDSPPRPPPGTVIRTSKLEYPEPLPFAFAGQSTKQEEPAALDFKRAHASSLNLMKTLGLPAPTASSASPAAQPKPGLNSFQQSSNSSLAFMKNLGSPDPQSAAGTGRPGFARPSTSAAGPAAAPRSAPPAKRLGMGRAPAPWGSKKA